jgi:2-C-methyl-D-erythritol 4-phosphate cytidylyltransferase
VNKQSEKADYVKLAVILPAAGLGTRMQRTPSPTTAETTGTSRKQFMLLENAPILVHTVRKFVASPLVHDIVVAVREDDIDWVSDMLHKECRGVFGDLKVVAGGNARQESVENALAALDPDTDLVAVHDAVRPFIDLDTIRRVVEEAQVTGAAIVGIVPVDTVKQVSGAQAGGAKVRSTISRERLILAQTPQVFRLDILRRAFEMARQDNFTGTDESSLVERLEQVEISVVLGSDRNIKITRPNDMDLARLFFEHEAARR